MRLAKYLLRRRQHEAHTETAIVSALERRRHRYVRRVRVGPDARGSVSGKDASRLGEKIATISMASKFGHNSEISNHRIVLIGRRDGEPNELAVGRMREPPPVSLAS